MREIDKIAVEMVNAIKESEEITKESKNKPESGSLHWLYSLTKYSLLQ